MLPTEFLERLRAELTEIDAAGLTKQEWLLTTAQGVHVGIAPENQPASRGQGVDGFPASFLNLCSNDYLGLASHPEVIAAAREALESAGHGMASVRFICGSHVLHRQLEKTLAEWLGYPDTILFSSGFDANAGLFEVLLGPEDVVIADRLIHASLIDGIRLSKTHYDTYKNADAAHLRRKLEQWRDKARTLLIVTDGVFSMDGILAPLDELAALADEFGALLLVDDSHATGVLGESGRGTPELFHVEQHIDILTTTLGKALGGASGGIVAGPTEVIELLRNRARPYLFSNSVAPALAAGALKAIRIARNSPELRQQVLANAAEFRRLMSEAGFALIPGNTPIVPVMLGDARVAAEMAQKLLAEGVFVVGFSHPVVPLGKARIRVQLSAAHTPEQIQQAGAAFMKVREEMGL